MPRRRPRDREFEQRTTRELTPGLGVDVEPIIMFAERRADKAEEEYGKGFPTDDRDLDMEGLEEGSDWRNYIVWAMQRTHCAGQDDWRNEHRQRALRYVILAFEEIRHII